MKLTLKKSNSEMVNKTIVSTCEDRGYCCGEEGWVFAPETTTSIGVLLVNSKFKLSQSIIEINSCKFTIDCSGLDQENMERLYIVFQFDDAVKEVLQKIDTFLSSDKKSLTFECKYYSLDACFDDEYGMPTLSTLFDSKRLAANQVDYSYREDPDTILAREEQERQEAEIALKAKQDSVKTIQLTLKKSNAEAINQSVVSICNSHGLSCEDKERLFAPELKTGSKVLLVNPRFKLLAEDKEGSKILQIGLPDVPHPDEPLEGFWELSMSAGGTFSDLYLYFESEDVAKEMLQKIDRFTNSNTEHLTFTCKHYFLNELALEAQEKPGVYERIILASNDEIITNKTIRWW